MKVTCRQCNGFGSYLETYEKFVAATPEHRERMSHETVSRHCWKCDGTGEVEHEEPRYKKVSCDWCDGTGYLHEYVQTDNEGYHHKKVRTRNKCHVCDGTGKVTERIR